MATRIDPHTEYLIEEMVSSGRYANAAEVVEQAVRLLSHRDRKQRLIASIKEAVASVERGEGVELTDDLWNDIHRKAEEAERAGRPLRRDVLP